MNLKTWEEICINKKARALKILSEVLEHLEHAKVKLDSVELTELADEVSKLRMEIIKRIVRL